MQLQRTMAAEAEAAREARAKVILSTKTQHINNHQKGKAVFLEMALLRLLQIKSIHNL